MFGKDPLKTVRGVKFSLSNQSGFKSAKWAGPKQPNPKALWPLICCCLPKSAASQVEAAAGLSHIIQTNQGGVTVWVVSGWWNTLAIPGCLCTAWLPLQVNQSQRNSAPLHPTGEPSPNHLSQWQDGFWKWPLAIGRGTICSVCFLGCLPLKMSVYVLPLSRCRHTYTSWN